MFRNVCLVFSHWFMTDESLRRRALQGGYVAGFDEDVSRAQLEEFDRQHRQRLQAEYNEHIRAHCGLVPGDTGGSAERPRLLPCYFIDSLPVDRAEQGYAAAELQKLMVCVETAPRFDCSPVRVGQSDADKLLGKLEAEKGAAVAQASAAAAQQQLAEASLQVATQRLEVAHTQQAAAQVELSTARQAADRERQRADAAATEAKAAAAAAATAEAKAAAQVAEAQAQAAQAKAQAAQVQVHKPVDSAERRRRRDIIDEIDFMLRMQFQPGFAQGMREIFPRQ